MLLTYAGRRLAAILTVCALGLSVSGCGGGTTQRPKPDPLNSALAQLGTLSEKLEVVPEKLDTDGTTIIVGDPQALVTVHLYEDPRCPVCQEFELTGGGPPLRVLTEWGVTKTEYTFASFLDDRVGGSGSKKAVNALRAALEAGKFAEYHALLYQHQPEESVDGYTDAYLLELADKVEGLRGPEFDTAVRTMKYRDFVTRSERAYERADEEDTRGPGTPTVLIDDVLISEEHRWVLFDREAFGRLLITIRTQPWRWVGPLTDDLPLDD
ncbi:thioredoxin domain-containing protein [Streptomyces sp. NPDC058770]